MAVKGVCACARTRVCVYVSVHMCVCVCTRCMHACVCVCVCELIYVHYTHTCMDMLTSSIAQGICIVIALFSMTSSCFHGETFVCGFDNSSIHTWRNRPTTTSSKRIQTNKSYSYLSLDDHNNDSHSGMSMDRRWVVKIFIWNQLWQLSTWITHGRKAVAELLFLIVPTASWGVTLVQYIVLVSQMEDVTSSLHLKIPLVNSL